VWFGPAVHAASFDFWYANTGRAGEAIQELCAKFNAEQSYQRVRCAGQGGYELAMQKAIAAYRAAKQPAIAQVLDIGTLDMLLSGAIEPVARLMDDAGTAVDPSEYIAGVYNYYASASGQLYSLPFNASTLVLYTNDAALRRAGINEAPATWEAFETVLRRLKVRGSGCPFAFQLHPWWFLEQVSAIEGEPIASGYNGYDSLEPRYVFASAVHRRMMQDLQRWHAAGLALTSEQVASGHFLRAFNSGECAMVLASTASDSSIRAGARSSGFTVSVHLVPHYTGHQRHNTLVGGSSLWVFKGFDAGVYRGVAAFLAFLRTPRSQLYLTHETGYLPVTRGAQALAEREFAQSDTGMTIRIGLESLGMPGNANSRGVRLGAYGRFRRIWVEEMQRAFGGDETLTRALDEAGRRGDELLERFSRMYAGESPPLEPGISRH
jgi:sn-glycerol 3-phosphate transport system substrate-binding protein